MSATRKSLAAVGPDRLGSSPWSLSLEALTADTASWPLAASYGTRTIEDGALVLTSSQQNQFIRSYYSTPMPDAPAGRWVALCWEQYNPGDGATYDYAAGMALTDAGESGKFIARVNVRSATHTAVFERDGVAVVGSAVTLPSLAFNAWSRFVFMRKDGAAYLYINGVLVNSTGAGPTTGGARPTAVNIGTTGYPTSAVKYRNIKTFIRSASDDAGFIPNAQSQLPPGYQA